MMQIIRKLIGWLGLKIIGWKFSDNSFLDKKMIIVSVPHTSNLDFMIGMLACFRSGIKVHFMIKKEWFFFPVNLFLKALGGIPVDRSNPTVLIEKIIKKFRSSNDFALLITPEGTRKPVKKWKKGFLYIATQANVPVYLGSIDYKLKELKLGKKFIPSGNDETDMKEVVDYYRKLAPAARHPEKFLLHE